MNRSVKILLVEDNSGDVVLLKGVLLKPPPAGQFFLSNEGTLDEAIARANGEPFDIILLDLNLPDSAGLDTVRRMRAATRLPIIVLTSVGDDETGIEAVRMGVQDYLVKGHIDAQTLSRSVRYATQRHRLEAELLRAKETLEQLVAQRTGELERSLDALGEESARHQRAEDAVKEAEERFMVMSEAQPDAFFMLSPTMDTVFYCNSAYERIWGRPRRDLYINPHCWLEAARREDRKNVESAVAQWLKRAQAGPAQAPRAAAEFAFRIDRPDGSTAAIRCRLFPVYGRTGHLCYVCGVAEDVSARQPAEESGDALIVIGADGRVATWNENAECLFARPASDTVGELYCDVLSVMGKVASERSNS